LGHTLLDSSVATAVLQSFLTGARRHLLRCVLARLGCACATGGVVLAGGCRGGAVEEGRRREGLGEEGIA
jgi:hypothetical protein